MGAKSIVEIDVQDASFKEFHALFEKYRAQLEKMPGAWGKTGKEVVATANAFAAVGKSLQNAADQEKKIETAGDKFKKASESTARTMRAMAKDTKSLAANLFKATTSLLKWAGLTSLFSGLLGAGGLFGIDRLAHSVAGSRRSAQGLGLTSGEQKAFGTNYGRYVDSDAYLSNVNDALHDQSKRWSLYAAGLTEADIKGKSTADVAQKLIPLLKKRYEEGGKTVQGAEARGLTNFASLQDLNRLSATSDKDLAESSSAYDRDKKTLNVDDATQKSWQDFTVQLSRAGQTIENVFVRGLGPLIGPLGKLSDAIARALGTVLGSPKLGQWIDAAGAAIERFAVYLTTPEFESDIKAFVQGVGQLAAAIVNGLKLLGIIAPAAKTPQELAKDKSDKTAESESGVKHGWFGIKFGKHEDFEREDAQKKNPANWASGRAAGGAIKYGNTPAPATPSAPSNGSPSSGLAANNNPGNLRSWGSMPVRNGFAAFPSTDAGIKAMAKQLQLYQNRDKIDTISGIVNKYAPAGDHNDVGAYIKDVVNRTGYKADEHLDLNNKDVLSKLVSAMTKHENSRNNYSPATVVTILNNTGGSAIVQTAQVAQ